MNVEVSIIKNVIWEEKNSIEPEKNYLNNNVTVPKDITNETKNDLTKKAWQDIGKVSGIYKIINKINGKYYIGSSQNICGNCFSRWEDHLRDLRKNKHDNPHLQNAWNKYGEDNFEFIIVEKTKLDFKILKDIEQKYLDISKTEKDKCYNISEYATSPMRGRKHSDNFFKKMKGRIPVNKGKKGLQECFWKGKHMSLQAKQNMSNSRKGRFIGKNNPLYGRTISEEHRKKLRDSHKGIFKGKFHPMYGRKHSEQSLKKMSQSHKGQLIGINNPKYSFSVYTFKNINTGELFNGTRYEFQKKFQYRTQRVTELIRKRRKQYKGWVL